MISLSSLTFNSKELVMSCEAGNDWDEILKGKWKAYDVEKSLYVDSVNKANSPDERAKNYM